MWLTDDGGASWRSGNEGIIPRYLPEDLSEEEIAYCVHSLERAPARPERMFMQFHGGVYRSDDAGATWTDIAPGLPADFGFPIALDPADPDSAYVIPLISDLDRVTVDGHVRVYETRDAGASWTPRGEGLPSDEAYLTILREAFAWTGEGERAGALLRRDVGRRVRLGGRRPELVRRGAEPAAGPVGHSGISALTVVPPPGGESTVSSPDSASMRSHSPARPLPECASAPPTPSSLISRHSRSPSTPSAIVAVHASAYLATLVSVSAVTK